MCKNKNKRISGGGDGGATTATALAELYAELSAKCTKLEGTCAEIQRQIAEERAREKRLVARLTKVEDGLAHVSDDAMLADYFGVGGDDHAD